MTAKRKATSRECLRQMEALLPFDTSDHGEPARTVLEDLLDILNRIIREYDLDVYGVLAKLVDDWTTNQRRARLVTHDYIEAFVRICALRSFALARQLDDLIEQTEANKEKKQ